MATITNIFAEARALVDASSTQYIDATVLRRCNAARQEINAKLIALNKNIKFDEHNQTDLPYGDFDLENGVQSYAYGSSILAIDRVEVQDNSGNWHKLNPISEATIKESLAEYKGDAGLPEEYSRRANSLFLYPAPATANVTLSGGGRIYYQRTVTDWTTDDISTGTVEGGFPNDYLISYKIALPYALTYKKDRVPMIMSEINRMEKELFDIESNKDGDREPKLIPNVEDNR